MFKASKWGDIPNKILSLLGNNQMTVLVSRGGAGSLKVVLSAMDNKEEVSVEYMTFMFEIQQHAW